MNDQDSTQHFLCLKRAAVRHVEFTHAHRNEIRFSETMPDGFIDWFKEKLAETENVDQLGRLLMFPIPNRDMGMRLLGKVRPVITPLESIPFHFGCGSFAWYTIRMQSTCGKHNAVVVLSKIEVASPLSMLSSSTNDPESNLSKNDNNTRSLYHCVFRVTVNANVRIGQLEDNEVAEENQEKTITSSAPSFLIGSFEKLGMGMFRFQGQSNSDNHTLSINFESTKTGEFDLILRQDIEDKHYMIHIRLTNIGGLGSFDGRHSGNPNTDKSGYLQCCIPRMRSYMRVSSSSSLSSSPLTFGMQQWDNNDYRLECNGLGWLSHQWNRSGPSPNGALRYWNQVQKRLTSVESGRSLVRRSYLKVYIQFYNNDNKGNDDDKTKCPPELVLSSKWSRSMLPGKTFFTRQTLHDGQHLSYHGRLSTDCCFTMQLLSSTRIDYPRRMMKNADDGVVINVPTKISIVSCNNSNDPEKHPLSGYVIDIHSSNTSSSFSSYSVDGGLIGMPDGTYAWMAAGFLREKDSSEAVGYVWIELSNSHNLATLSDNNNNGSTQKNDLSTVKRVEIDRIRFLLDCHQIKSRDDGNQEKENLAASTLNNADIDMWNQCENTSSVWYTVFFVLFLVLVFIWIILYILSPFLSRRGRSKSSSYDSGKRKQSKLSSNV